MVLEWQETMVSGNTVPFGLKITATYKKLIKGNIHQNAHPQSESCMSGQLPVPIFNTVNFD